ncbi:CapA family protein [Jeotgalibacillus sp. R-1-5s-1]|uniref:CapA family protein n=1 Tax=Jeotgalibacillus sp. R-1-5s-1 TaxID=2555897 RepID=UPI0010695451|nr:CapA family protein [Jeotgalibacillus sp. R-1-5s-1]TFD93638.1 CapA family protein [Jeotgalibacillus sp. R-1-5s-1]
MYRRMLFILSLFLLLSACAAGTIYFNAAGPDSLNNNKNDTVDHADTIEGSAENTSSTQTAHFTAVGDLLVERPILYDAMQKDGSFNFDPLMSNVRNLIEKGDFAYANQETPITGSEFGLGDGNFVFNNPYELGHYYYETGFNMLQLVNNHTLDMGYSGLERNIAFWEENYPDVLLSGAHLSSEERQTIPIIEKEGISIALISSTYSSNLPVERPYSVNIFTDNEEQLLDDVARADKMADLVVVGMHWGQEYQQPVEAQEKLAQSLVQNGADIILGHHPHVLQPIEWIEGPENQRALVAYSLGNFISGPFDDRVPHLDCERLTGTMIGFDLTKENEQVQIDSVYAVPTFTSFSEDYTNYQILPLSDFEQDDFRWCNLETHKNNVIETLSERMSDIEIRMGEMENK